MVDEAWRATHPWADLLRKFSHKLRNKGRDINEGYVALLVHAADELDARQSKLGQAVEQRDNAMRDAFQKGLRLDSALSLLLIHYAKADTVMPNECDELEAAIGFIKGTAVERQA